VLLVLGGLRLFLGVLAILLAKFLYEDHFLWLALMRPTKEVFLAGGFLAKKGEQPSLLLEVLLAGLPLSIAGVWLSYFLGRMFSKEIRSGHVPGLAGRILPVKKIHKLEKLLKKKGTKLIFLGRLAVFPSSVIGSAAGSTEMPSKRFLPADALGAFVAILEVLALGYGLGGFYDKDDPVTSWTITGLGALATFELLFLAGRYLRRE
jgi:membrane protein DedA with SNARE-associated domain